MQIFLGQNVSSFVKLFSLIELHVNNTADQWLSWTYPRAQSHVEEPVWRLKEVELVYEQCNIDTHPRSLRGKKPSNHRIRPLPLSRCSQTRRHHYFALSNLRKRSILGARWSPSQRDSPSCFSVVTIQLAQNLRSRGQEAEYGSAWIIIVSLARYPPEVEIEISITHA